MAGWFRLFGSKSKRNDENAKAQDAEAFFLDPDDAKSMGDIDYMRTVKAVRKTFPKTVSWGESFATVDEVSALNKVSSVDGVPITPSPSPEAAPEPIETPTFQRRQTDSSMDVFRKMAKDLNK
ncbi:hypothetical protein GS597_12305 [Synechococcales cyanobacterium C]|uniref:Uncharacterized protein n=1 Tax=Petrachloros mirabilis ULC683 TaxID=2781853 RepID=A0A8K2A041_9CYAN|nr:hypothetical protein [Petrachloros mirabilis]NCJ07273.1 hypothetical protein [Petrachloros mirabilis ULC683]